MTALPKCLKGLTLVLLFVFLAGCRGGFMEAYESRVCWENGIPVQCREAFLDFRCDRAIEVPVLARSSSQAIGTQLLNEMLSPRIGELFSQTCPPNCIPIYVRGGSPYQSLERDLRDILKRSGYLMAGAEEEPDERLEIDIDVVRVVTDKPGWTDMKVTTRSEVAFSVRLVRGGTRQWEQSFSGHDEVAHAYAAISDYQMVLGNAYCTALQDFASTAPDTIGTYLTN